MGILLLDDVQSCVDELLRAGHEKLLGRENVSISHAFPKEAGVYIFLDGKQVVYVGECINLHKRLRQHWNNTSASALRRSIGEKLTGKKLSGQKGEKYPNDIEQAINNVVSKLTIGYLQVVFGRKELEEYITKKESPIYNKHGNCKK